MANIDQLAEQHIRQYEAKLKHIDEIMARAHDTTAKNEDLKELAGHRDELAEYIEELREKAPFEWMEEGGPMVVWDIIGERIQELVERIEH